jgi:hypothetical protein
MPCAAPGLRANREGGKITCFDFNAASKVHAGRVIGRCHAALEEHALSVSAFDAAIELARRGRFLLSEVLAIRGRAWAGRDSKGGGNGSGLHWDEREGGSICQR